MKKSYLFFNLCILILLIIITIILVLGYIRENEKIGSEITKNIDEEEKVIYAYVFLEYDITELEIRETIDKIEKIEEIKKITLITPEEAYNTMKERLGDNGKAMDGFGPDIFSFSCEIEVEHSKWFLIKNKINKLKYVRKIVESSTI